MNKIILIFIIVIFSFNANALDEKKFNELMSYISEKKLPPVERFLKENQKSNTDDPEYYVILLNYVLCKGEDRRIIIGKGEPRENEFSLTNKDTGELEGFLGERVFYNKELILSGITKTQKALNAFKQRLDIHFGIITAAERIEKWKMVADQIILILQVSHEINNQWTWGKINTMQGEPKEFMIQNILPRASRLFRLDSNIGDAQFVRLSKALIQYYPKLIYGYANMGTLHMAKGEYKEAENYYQKALKIDKNDEIVIENLNKLKKLKATQ